jgi:hypothetical protein
MSGAYRAVVRYIWGAKTVPSTFDRLFCFGHPGGGHGSVGQTSAAQAMTGSSSIVG